MINHFKDSDKYYIEKSKHDIRCECGYLVSLEDKETKICKICYRTVYKDKNIEFKEKLNAIRRRIDHE